MLTCILRHFNHGIWPWLCISEYWVSQCFDLFPAGYCVPHAGPAQRIHIFNNDERSLLQSHDGQVVVSLLRSWVQLKAGPHVVPHRQRASLPLTNLREWVGGGLCDIQASVTATSSDRGKWQITEGEKYKPGKNAEDRWEEEREEETGCRKRMKVEKENHKGGDIHPVPLSILVEKNDDQFGEHLVTFFTKWQVSPFKCHIHNVPENDNSSLS